MYQEEGCCSKACILGSSQALLLGSTVRTGCNTQALLPGKKCFLARRVATRCQRTDQHRTIKSCPRTGRLSRHFLAQVHDSFLEHEGIFLEHEGIIRVPHACRDRLYICRAGAVGGQGDFCLRTLRALRLRAPSLCAKRSAFS